MDEHITTEENQVQIYRAFYRPVTDVQLPACLNSNQTEAHMRGQIVDKGRFIHTGYGMNAFQSQSRQIQYIAEMM